MFPICVSHPIWNVLTPSKHNIHFILNDSHEPEILIYFPTFLAKLETNTEKISQCFWYCNFYSIRKIVSGNIVELQFHASFMASCLWWCPTCAMKCIISFNNCFRCVLYLQSEFLSTGRHATTYHMKEETQPGITTKDTPSSNGSDMLLILSLSSSLTHSVSWLVVITVAVPHNIAMSELPW